MNLLDRMEGEDYFALTDGHVTSIKLYEDLRNMQISAFETMSQNRLRLSSSASLEIAKLDADEFKHFSTSSLLLFERKIRWSICSLIITI